MLVLSIIAAVAIFALVGWGLYLFESRVEKKFGYRFFSAGSFLALFISSALCFFGFLWWHSESLKNGDILNGIIIGGLGLVVVLATVFVNFKKTNLVYGLFGSIIQLSLFVVLLPIGLLFVVAKIIGMFFEAFTTQNVRVIE